MFTVKLMMNGGKVRLVEAESVVVYQYENCASQITSRTRNDEGEGCLFYVGRPPFPTSEEVWDVAFVENAAGKTTHKVFAGPAQQVQAAPSVLS